MGAGIVEEADHRFKQAVCVLDPFGCELVPFGVAVVQAGIIVVKHQEILEPQLSCRVEGLIARIDNRAVFAEAVGGVCPIGDGLFVKLDDVLPAVAPDVFAGLIVFVVDHHVPLAGVVSGLKDGLERNDAIRPAVREDQHAEIIPASLSSSSMSAISSERRA